MIVPRHIPNEAKRIPFEHLCNRVVNGVKRYFVCIDYDVIRRVDFGPRADSDQVSRLIAELKTRGDTGHITFWQAELKPGCYTYDYSRVA